MRFNHNQVIDSDDFRGVHYTIGPFTTNHLPLIESIVSKEQDLECLEYFFGKEYDFTESGREAIYKSLLLYDLNENDEVCIFTTSGNLYVSSCVTKEIEKVCKWSRSITENTKIIFVVHEFGMLYKDLEKLETYGLPIIEDYAMSMFSKNPLVNNSVSDIAIYSLPKFFPIQFGGVIRYNKLKPIECISNTEKSYDTYLKKCTSFFLSEKNEIVSKRRNVYEYYQQFLGNIGLKTRFELEEYEVPSVFMFSTDNVDLDDLKVFLQRNGIECSKFYGENTFFLPVNQSMSKFDVKYIVEFIKFFINESK